MKIVVNTWYAAVAYPNWKGGLFGNGANGGDGGGDGGDGGGGLGNTAGGGDDGGDGGGGGGGPRRAPGELVGAVSACKATGAGAYTIHTHALGKSLMILHDHA